MNGGYWDVHEAAWRTWSPAEPSLTVVPDIPHQLVPAEAPEAEPSGVGSGAEPGSSAER